MFRVHYSIHGRKQGHSWVLYWPRIEPMSYKKNSSLRLVLQQINWSHLLDTYILYCVTLKGKCFNELTSAFSKVISLTSGTHFSLNHCNSSVSSVKLCLYISNSWTWNRKFSKIDHERWFNKIRLFLDHPKSSHEIQ